MQDIKREFKAMLTEITGHSLTEDLKDSFVRKSLIDATTKPMMSYTSSMLKLRCKIDREDSEAVELFNATHQGAMDAYGMLLSLVSLYDENYINILISKHNTEVAMLTEGFVTKPEVEALKKKVIKVKDNHTRYTAKHRELVEELVSDNIKQKHKIEKLEEEIEILTS